MEGRAGETGRAESWPVAREWAQQAERLGFHGIWVFDHFQPYPARDDSPVLEAWTTLAALSQATERVVLGTLVSCAAYRPPGVTVKMAENLHRLSGGRFCLGRRRGLGPAGVRVPWPPVPLRRGAIRPPGSGPSCMRHRLARACDGPALPVAAPGVLAGRCCW